MLERRREVDNTMMRDNDGRSRSGTDMGLGPLRAFTTALMRRRAVCAIALSILLAGIALFFWPGCGGGFLDDNENASEFDESIFGTDDDSTSITR
jgi:hypothetical protein